MIDALLHPGTLPFGYPDLDAITDTDFVPAFRAAMAHQLTEIAAITAQDGEPSFDGVLVALERSGQQLRRVESIFEVLTWAASTPQLRAAGAELAAERAAHEDAILLDPALFAQVSAVHERRDELELDEESRRLVEHWHRDMVRAGAGLDAAAQQRLRELNAELAALSTEFASRQLAGTAAGAVHVTDPARLAGLSPSTRSAAARAAADRGLDGHLLTLELWTAQPVLAQLEDRELRREVYEASAGRGTTSGDTDTRDLVVDLARLRAQRARLLGHPDHASWVVETSTAADLVAVDALLDQLIPVAAANASAELAGLAELAGHPIEAWDRPYWAQRWRAEHHGLDTGALPAWFELDRVLRDGVFAAAERLYGLRFAPRHDLPRHHPDVRVYDVFDDGAGPDSPVDGGQLGLFVLDPYAHDGKRGGAWMNTFVVQSHLLGTRPIVLNTLNLDHPADGEPTLLSLGAVTTLFHEFGHALHGLLSDVRYPRFSGTAVPRDFVEFPSQVNEMWKDDPELLDRYARHHVTGAPLPDGTVEQLAAAGRSGEGCATTEYLAATVLDLAWHRLDADTARSLTAEDVPTFEADVLARAGLDLPAVPPRYRSTYFSHVFSGGYAAGYYSYIWAEVLDADTVDWFAEHGGLRRDNGLTFRQALLSRGGAVDPMAAYRAFRGRDPRVEPLLVRRGLTASTT